MQSQTKWILGAGLFTGAVSVLLVALGNPGNMGFCIACFLRDIAGAVGMHRAAVVQYVRPEVIGLVLGAMGMAFVSKEWGARGGSSPAIRFLMGAFVMVGALMFLGCPLRMVLRIAGGDWNGLVGLTGFIAGILVGIWFLNRGFSLRKSHPQSRTEGMILPGVMTGLLVLLISYPAILFFSEKGPGSMYAPMGIALAAGLIVGALAQKSRLCMVGGLRDAFLFRDFYLLWGFLAVFAAAFVGNLITSKFHPGFTGQPIAFVDFTWNFLGMALVGLGSALLGGCPLRQLILAGSGNSDGAMAVFGMIFGAAFCHNFGLASSGEGATGAGKIAVLLGFAVLLIIGVTHLPKQTER